jgi:preprotein translocase subunit SecA
MRKQLLEYDDVANDQAVIYQQRNDIMDGINLAG